jgi:DNA invertase Pin-like site-specific DNA recombinase
MAGCVQKTPGGQRSARAGDTELGSASLQSVENQLRELEAVAERHGWTVAEVFRDAGVSGATAEPPGYKRLK